MFTRRQFLCRSGLATLGLAGTALAFPNEAGDDAVPDGSASRGMITPDVERAIESGLAFLKNEQHADGGFGTGIYRAGNVAITSLAGLAMMSGGHQPGRGAYGSVVTEALKFVMNQEAGTSGYLHNPIATPHGPMYGHGFGTLFLAEVYGMVHDERLRRELRDKLRRAVQLILGSQNHEGGWRYTPQSTDADISVTICQIMALRAARNAGFAVPKSKVDACVKYVKRCQDKREGWFTYQAQQPFGGPRFGDHQAFARTAAGVVALYSAGIYKGTEIETGLKYLMRCKPNSGQVHHAMHYFYGHYYAAQAMWTAGGEYWSEWYPLIREELLSRRRPDGSWFDNICSHYATAMACIILQIPNNYLPILQK
jgi:prenyltransferase/squalene oxidase-like repeat protein